MKLSIFIILSLSLIGCLKIQKKSAPSDNATADSANVFSDLSHEPDIVVDEDSVFYNGKIESLKKVDLQNFIFSEANEQTVNFHSLTIKSGTTLFTLGAKITFNIQNFESFHGTIASYPSQIKSTTNFEKAFSGGVVKINTSFAEGTLFVKLDGQNGKDGIDGKEPSAKMVKGHVYCSISMSKNNPADCRFVPDSTNEYIGFDGLAGDDGGAGGNAGDFYFYKLNSSSFQIVNQSIPGKGGIEGRGSIGGKIMVDENSMIPFTAKIPENRGRMGLNGQRGPNGKNGHHCISENGSIQCSEIKNQ